MNGTAQVRYVDLGFTSARQFWIEVGLPAYKRFIDDPNGRTAIEAACQSWHVHEWLWHEDQRELAWVQDIAEAGKHCGLKRLSVTVARAAQLPVFVTFGKEPIIFCGATTMYGSTLQIELDDGSRHDVTSVLAMAVAFWKVQFGL